MEAPAAGFRWFVCVRTGAALVATIGRISTHWRANSATDVLSGTTSRTTPSVSATSMSRPFRRCCSSSVPGRPFTSARYCLDAGHARRLIASFAALAVDAAGQYANSSAERVQWQELLEPLQPVSPKD